MQGFQSFFYKIVLISQKCSRFLQLYKFFHNKIICFKSFQKTCFSPVIFGVLYHENGNLQLGRSILCSSVSGMKEKKIGEDPMIPGR